MTPFSDLMAAIALEDQAYRVSVTPDWLQGRTLYGGMSAALCIETALRAFPDLPPLRAAQFAFIGPVSGDVAMTPTLLRRGKSATCIGVDLMGESGIGTRAILFFGTARPSAISHDVLAMPPVAGPDACPDFFGDRPRPTFGQHFDVKLAAGARPVSGAKDADLLLWIRHRDAGAGDGPAALAALGDAPPPAAMSLFTAPAPISTMMWSGEFFPHATPADQDDGWRLIRSAAETALEGYSSQPMGMWDSAGRPLLASRQCVAVFA